MSNGPTGPARQLSRSELQRRQSTAIRRTGLTVGGERIFRGPSGSLQTESEARASQRVAEGGPSGRVLVVDGETVQATSEQVAPLAAATREFGPLRAERTAEGGFVFSAPRAQALQEQSSVRALNLGDPRVAQAVRELADQGLSPREIFDFAERNVPFDTVASGFARASFIGPRGEDLEVVVDRQGRVVQVLSSTPREELSPVVGSVERGPVFGLFDSDSSERQPFFFSRVRDRLEDAPVGDGFGASFARFGRGVAAGAAGGLGLAERAGTALFISDSPFVDIPGVQPRRERLQQELSDLLPFFTSDPRDSLSGVGPALRTFEPDPFLPGSIVGEGLVSLPLTAPRQTLSLARSAARSPVVRVPARIASQPLVDAGLAARQAGRGFVRLFDDPVSGLPPRFVSVGADPVSGRPFAVGDLPSTIDFGVVAPRRRVVERSAIDSRSGQRVDLGLTSQELAELGARPGGEQQLLLAAPREQAGRALVTESGEVVGFVRDPSFRSDELLALQQRQADELAGIIRQRFEDPPSPPVLPPINRLGEPLVTDNGDIIGLLGFQPRRQVFERELSDFFLGVRDDTRSVFPSRRFSPDILRFATRPDVPGRSIVDGLVLSDSREIFSLPRNNLAAASRLDVPGVRGRRAQFAPTVQVTRVTRVPRVRSPLSVVDDLVDGRVSRVPVDASIRFPVRSGLGFLSGGRGLLGQVDNLASGSVSALDSSLLGGVDSRLLLDSAQGLDSGLIFDSDVRLDSRSLTRSRSRLDSRSILSSDVALEQLTRARPVVVPRSSGRPSRSRSVPRPRVPVDVDTASFSSADAALGDFRVVVGRPGNVVYRDLGVGGRELIQEGKELVRNSAAASLTVVPTNPSASRKNVLSKLGGAFKKGRRKNTFVERREKRIDSPGELADITARGLSAVRSAGSPSRAPDAARELVDLGVPLRTVRRRARSGGLLDDFF